MMDFQKIISKAENSSFYLWLLNRGLWRMVPFNKPHGFYITQISHQKIVVKTPYKKANKNHIKGLHACSLATASEYATGLLLLLNLNAKKYRIIMESLQASYHFQGKTAAFTTFELVPETITQQVIEPLTKKEKVYFLAEVKTYDQLQNHLCTVKVNWQIKSWEKVKTKV